MNDDTKIEVNKIETTEKLYTFRRLNSTDIFAMSRLISKIGIKDFGKCFENETLAKLISQTKSDNADKSEKDTSITSIIGVNVILNISDVILENLSRCENELYAILSRTSNLPVDSIKAFEPAVFVEMIIDFCKKEELQDFMKAVSKLKFK